MEPQKTFTERLAELKQREAELLELEAELFRQLSEVQDQITALLQQEVLERAPVASLKRL